MLPDVETCYRAVKTHDPRFDGRWFVAVSSTRIYCRTVCKARTPKSENCVFFPSAAAAEAAGFRPCLRCRPELAPGNASVDAPSRLAQAAAGLIEDASAEDDSVDALARRLRVSDRHLRRVFHAEFGVAPIAYAQTQRLLLAKRLLTDTRMPVTEVALASGFRSLRRFNACFRARYRMTPSALRRAPVARSYSDDFYFELAFRPPLAWEALLRFLAARAIEGVEQVDAGRYRRTVVIHPGPHVGWIEVSLSKRKAVLGVRVAALLSKVLPAVLARVKRLFDLSCDPAEIVRALGPLAAAEPGLRLPGAFDPFEVAVRAILGQQVSVRAARTLAGRLVTSLGTAVATPFSGLHHSFPSAEQIAQCAPERIAKLGIVRSRAQAIVSLAHAVSAGNLPLEPGVNVDATLARLCALPGIGEWTAQYIAMRALAWPDAFPHRDLGVMKALRETDPRRVLKRAERWRPWRAYAVMHLWSQL